MECEVVLTDKDHKGWGKAETKTEVRAKTC